MSVSAGEVCRWIDAFAPFALAEEWDNVGLLAGAPSKETEAILLALDLTPEVLAEAERIGAGLIVTHHPILFRGRKNLRTDDAEGRLLCALVRANIALIAAHTNFDNAVPGVNDALAQALGLSGVRALENGMRVGTPQEALLGAFRSRVERTLGGPVRLYGRPESRIHAVALLGGAGGDFAAQARAAGADVYVTGEIAHHKANDAYQEGLNVLEAGHAATELPAISMLAKGLQKAADGVKCKVRIVASEVEPFR